MKTPTESLLSKIILRICVSVVLIGTVLIVPSVILYWRVLGTQDRLALRVRAGALAHILASEMVAGRPVDLSAGLRKLGGQEPGTQAVVLDAKGSVIQSLGNAIEPASVWRRMQALQKPGHAEAMEVALPLGPDAAKPIGYLYVKAAPRSVASKLATHVFATLGLLLLALFVGGLVIIHSLHRIVLKPIGRLLQANVAASEEPDESGLIEEDRIPNDELGQVMRSWNDALTKLQGYQRSVREKNTLLEQQQGELQQWAGQLERRVKEKSRILVQAQQQLIQTEKLAAVGKLASGLAHEMNNPLASIAGYAEDLLELCGSPELQDVREVREFAESLKIIEEQAFRCKTITKNLLNFARKTDLTIGDVNLNELLKETFSLVEYRARKRKVNILCCLEPSLPIIESDRFHLQQAIVNIVDNALDALDDGGEIELRTARDDGCVHVTISDNGPGIPEQVRSKIFDPFFTTKPVGSGTGLGLSICYGIVAKLHGSIEVDSEEGKGSTFRISLPIQQQQQQQE